MGGEIRVQSKKGEGSIFSFCLPLKPLEDTQTTHIENENAKEEIFFNANVLIVEDNKTNQMLLKIMLEELGIKTQIAHNGSEAVEMVQENSYDLILMDENMPVMNGMEATKKIRQLNIATPIIAVTANALKGDREKFLQAGMDDYLSKPIDDQIFLSVLRKFLEPV